MLHMGERPAQPSICRVLIETPTKAALYVLGALYQLGESKSHSLIMSKSASSPASALQRCAVIRNRSISLLIESAPCSK
jgi:hypothetical protein